MAKVKARTKATIKKGGRAPVKAGSTLRPHGGYPTQAVIRFNAVIKEKRNG